MQLISNELFNVPVASATNTTVRLPLSGNACRRYSRDSNINMRSKVVKAANRHSNRNGVQVMLFAHFVFDTGLAH